MTKVLQTKFAYSRLPIGATDTSIPLKYLQDTRGNYITAMPAGETIMYATIEPHSPTNLETISFTGIQNDGNNQVTLTGVTRNINPQPPHDALTPNVPHGNNVEIILSNSPSFYEPFLKTNVDATVTASIKFPNAVDPQNPVTLAQLIAVTLAGAVDATTSVKGIAKSSIATNILVGTATITIATPAVITTPTAHGLIAGDSVKFTTTGTLPTGFVVGVDYYVIASGLTSTQFRLSATVGGSAINTTGTQSGIHTLSKTTPTFIPENDPRILQNSFAVATGTANNYAITLHTPPTAYKSGQKYSFLSNFTNTGASTLNVAGLGAKSIKKLGGSTDLLQDDIANNSVVFVEFNETLDCFVMLSTSSIAPLVPKFGGNGSDGDLIVTGTTNIDCAGQQLVIKQYNSISITGTGKVTFSNPHANGTLVIFKCKRNAILTSSQVPMIDMSGMGGQAGVTGSNGSYILDVLNHGGGYTPTILSEQTNYFRSAYNMVLGLPRYIACGSGGANGNSASGAGGCGLGAGGAGGRGGGAFYLEVGGTLDFTTVGGISVDGKDGSNGQDSGYAGGGGSGGSAGMGLIIYNIAGTITGTITSKGGKGGNGGSSPGSCGTSANAGAGTSGASCLFLGGVGGATGGSGEFRGGGGGGGGAGNGGAGNAGATNAGLTGGLGGTGGLSGVEPILQNTNFA